MAKQMDGPVETGAAMDYAEHEKTYAGFLAASKYGTISIVALFVAMAVFFFRAPAPL
ncbi:aa3-type cytochrome c oxidase subunit IV [Hoeflea ulvae]|uniref:aa3-type cytochrome c oxidase subunit IV n=1 Tax=Hoeflea ulvae TaxID=2983764 RepID=UPI003CCCEAC0